MSLGMIFSQFILVFFWNFGSRLRNSWRTKIFYTLLRICFTKLIFMSRSFFTFSTSLGRQGCWSLIFIFFILWGLIWMNYNWSFSHMWSFRSLINYISSLNWLIHLICGLRSQLWITISLIALILMSLSSISMNSMLYI